MGLASEVAGAISEGVNGLCAFLAWMDGGSVGPPSVDAVALRGAMLALEGALRDTLPGGRLKAEGPSFTDDDLACVIRLKHLFDAWASTGELAPEVATLADRCVRALWGGRSWKELMDVAARR